MTDQRDLSPIGSAVGAAVLGGLLVMAAMAFLLFGRLGAVAAPVWDEAYYLPAAARLQEGRVQFASHPPLGILLIALGDSALGDNRSEDRSGVRHALAQAQTVGQANMPRGFDYRGPRLASALAGTFAAGVFFVLMRQITGSTARALWLSALFVLDTALVGQFRAAQLDAFQLLFVLSALVCLLPLLASEPPRSPAWLCGAAALLGLAAMVRANAAVLALCLVVPVWRRWRTAGLLRAAAEAILAAVCGMASVAAVLAAVLQLAPLPPDPHGPAGRAQAAHVSADYATLALPLRVAVYGRDYVRYLADDLDSMTRTDPNASHPAQWLIGGGAITYRWDATPARVATIALVPNRIVWLVSTAGMLAGLAGLRTRRTPRVVMLLLGWWASMGCLAWLDGQRVMYAYHHFIPLMFGHALLAHWWRERGMRLGPALPILLAATAYAAIALPLVLHQPVSPARCRLLLNDCGRPLQQS